MMRGWNVPGWCNFFSKRHHSQVLSLCSNIIYIVFRWPVVSFRMFPFCHVQSQILHNIIKVYIFSPRMRPDSNAEDRIFEYLLKGLFSVTFIPMNERPKGKALFNKHPRTCGLRLQNKKRKGFILPRSLTNQFSRLLLYLWVCIKSSWGSALVFRASSWRDTWFFTCTRLTSHPAQTFVFIAATCSLRAHRPSFSSHYSFWCPHRRRRRLHSERLRGNSPLYSLVSLLVSWNTSNIRRHYSHRLFHDVINDSAIDKRPILMRSVIHSSAHVMPKWFPLMLPSLSNLEMRE